MYIIIWEFTLALWDNDYSKHIKRITGKATSEMEGFSGIGKKLGSIAIRM